MIENKVREISADEIDRAKKKETDKDRLITLLKSFGIPQVERESFSLDGFEVHDREVILRVDGDYAGFRCWFNFKEDGSLKDYGVYE